MSMADNPTDTFAPRRTPPAKLQLRIEVDRDHVVIRDRDGKISPTVFPAQMVAKRMRPNERVAYFDGWLREHGVLEIGDRLPPAKVGW